MVPHLIERPVLTPNRDLVSVRLLESRLDGGARVGACRAGHDASGGEGVVGGEDQEEREGEVEVVEDFLIGGVVYVAGGGECGYAEGVVGLALWKGC